MHCTYNDKNFIEICYVIYNHLDTDILLILQIDKYRHKVSLSAVGNKDIFVCFSYCLLLIFSVFLFGKFVHEPIKKDMQCRAN